MTEWMSPTFGELDVAIVGGEMRLAAYLMGLEELEDAGQDVARTRELVRGAAAQLTKRTARSPAAGGSG